MLVSNLASAIVGYVTANAFASAVVHFTPKLLTTKTGVFGVFVVGTATTIAASKLTRRGVEKILAE